MIKGIGTDIIEISRIEKAAQNTAFLTRYFSSSENAYFLKKNNHPQTIAGNFAAKEAFSKALGTGFAGIALKDIEVLRDKFGKPYINLSGRARELAENSRILVTISHSEKYAVAYVVIEEEKM